MNRKRLFLPVTIFLVFSLFLAGCTQQDSVTISVNGQGTTVPSAGTYTYDDGNSLTVTANPAGGWKFAGWSGDASGNDETLSTHLDSNKNIVANFSKITYSLTLAVSGQGTAVTNGGNYKYVTPPSPSGYEPSIELSNIQSAVSAMMVDQGLTSLSNPVVVATANMSQFPDSVNRKVLYGFNDDARINYVTQQLTLGTYTVDNDGTVHQATTGNGNVSVNDKTSLIVDYGNSLTVTAIPANGWAFDSWDGDVASSSSPTTTVTMNSDKTITATFITQTDKNIQISKQIVEDYYKTHTYVGTQTGYAADIYVCGDMSSDVWDMLKTKGINAKIEIGNPKNNITHVYEATHAWVLAETSPDNWLALETTGGYVVYIKDNPLYYWGWSFDTPKQLKDYLSLQQQYDDQTSKYNAAITEYNRLVDLYNMTTNVSNKLAILVQVNAQAAVVTQRTNDVNQTQTKMLSLFSP